MTRTSSNACTKVAPVSSALVRATASVSSKPSPASSTCAPYPRAASTFAIGAASGTKIVAGMPACLAAHATACPWFPALAVTTPLPRSSSDSCATVL